MPRSEGWPYWRLMRATVGVAELVRDGVRRESALDRLRRTGVAQLVKLQALAVRPAPPNNAGESQHVCCVDSTGRA